MPDPSFQDPTQLSLVELQSVDSTNNYARRLVNEGKAFHGMAIFTREQLSGKGQRGKNWLSGKDENILLSILLNPAPLQLSAQFSLSSMVAVTLYDFFSKYAGDEVKIKWPNDLYWQDRKAGGVLIENVVTSWVEKAGSSRVPGFNGQEKDKSENFGPDQHVWKWAIVGIGININQTRFENLPNPVSLKQITGKNFIIKELVTELAGLLLKNFSRLIKEKEGSAYFLEKYNTHLYKKREVARFRKDNRVFQATIIEVTAAGQLKINHGIDEEIDFGEIEWVI